MLVLEWGSWDDRQNDQPLLRPGEGAITKTGKCSFAPRSHGSGVGLSTPASGRRVLHKRQEKLSEEGKEIALEAQHPPRGYHD